MLDIKFIRENKKEVEKAIKDKGVDLDLEKLLKIDEKRTKLIVEIEKLNSQKNKLNNEIKQAENRDEIIEKGKRVKEKLAKLEPDYKKIKDEFDELMARVPNIPSDDSPVGGEDANKEVEKWGEIPKFDFNAKDHVQIGKDLDILDLGRGAKISGYRGYYLKNEGMLLVMALMMYALGKMVEKGYKPMIPPTLVKEFVLFGSGHFKGLHYDGEMDEIYQLATSNKEADGKISKEKKFLVGTAEPSLLAYYANEVLEDEDLPIKICGFSQCYRSEIGSYGKDTKGLYRVHEFMKVEQAVLTRADIDESDKLHQEMLSISKKMHEELELPHRVVQISTGDMGAGKYKMFDIETWMPGMNRWGETGSASNLLDWQARRLNVKYKGEDGNRRFVYMLNNTALPSVRPLIAILENYQQADGSVKIPDVLQKYMPGVIKEIKKK